MKPSGILNFENVPADAGDPDVKVFVNGEEVSAGGGGDSDFTTATVTISAVHVTDIPLPFIDDTDGYECVYVIYPTNAYDAGVYKVPLYKGKLMVETNTSSITVTGDAEYSEGVLTITGDCEITAYTAAE